MYTAEPWGELGSPIIVLFTNNGPAACLSLLFRIPGTTWVTVVCDEDRNYCLCVFFLWLVRSSWLLRAALSASDYNAIRIEKQRPRISDRPVKDHFDGEAFPRQCRLIVSHVVELRHCCQQPQPMPLSHRRNGAISMRMRNGSGGSSPSTNTVSYDYAATAIKSAIRVAAYSSRPLGDASAVRTLVEVRRPTRDITVSDHSDWEEKNPCD